MEKKSTIILYYSNSCPYSIKMFSEWFRFCEYTKNNLKCLNVITNNCTEDIELAFNEGIYAFPTIILISAEFEIEFTSKNRTCDEFIKFVEKYVHEYDSNNKTLNNIPLLNNIEDIIIEI